MNKIAPRTFGYGCVVPSGKSASAQEKIFSEFGIGRTFIDKQDSSIQWGELVQKDALLGIRDTDTVYLVSEACLGPSREVRRARLNKLAKEGVKVATVGEDPMLYDTTEKRQYFLAASGVKAMKARGKAAAKAMGPGPGKPSKAALTYSQWNAARHFWQTSRADPYSFVSYLQECSAANGKPCTVTRDNLKDWLGQARVEGSRTEPPANLIIAEKPNGNR